VDVVSWLLQGQTNKALSYIAINNIGGIAAAAMGMTLMKKLLGTASK
jgi:fluoride ion exporter CrcB/FEX